ncbi:hypothetical protein BT69DRAFT_1305967, partial [Atractiella rhizophila]
RFISFTKLNKGPTTVVAPFVSSSTFDDVYPALEVTPNLTRRFINIMSQPKLNQSWGYSTRAPASTDLSQAQLPQIDPTTKAIVSEAVPVLHANFGICPDPTGAGCGHFILFYGRLWPIPPVRNVANKQQPFNHEPNFAALASTELAFENTMVVSRAIAELATILAADKEAMADSFGNSESTASVPEMCDTETVAEPICKIGRRVKQDWDFATSPAIFEFHPLRRRPRNPEVWKYQIKHKSREQDEIATTSCGLGSALKTLGKVTFHRECRSIFASQNCMSGCLHLLNYDCRLTKLSFLAPNYLLEGIVVQADGWTSALDCLQVLNLLLSVTQRLGVHVDQRKGEKKRKTM